MPRPWREVGSLRRHAHAAASSLAAVPLAALLLGPAPSLEAQTGGLSVNGGVSHSLPPPGSEADASTYLLGGLQAGLRGGADQSLFGSVYGGVSLEESSGDWGSASLGADLWAPVAGSFRLGLGARARGFVVGPPVEYRAATGELLPRAEVGLGPVRLRLEGRGGVGRSSVEVRDEPGLPGGLVPTAEVVTDLWYYGGGTRVRVPMGPLSLGAGGTYYEADAGPYREAFLEASGGIGDVSVAFSVRGWDTPQGDEVSGRLTLQVPVSDGWRLLGSGGRADPDPLLQTPVADQGSFVVSRRVVGFAPPEPLPVVEQEPVDQGARVTFALRRPQAEEVVVLGEFSGWEPVAMEASDGVWKTTVTLAPGVYHFGFRVDGSWFVPEGAPGRVEDEWGRSNAVVVVPGEGE